MILQVQNPQFRTHVPSTCRNLQQGQVHSFAVLHLHRISGDDISKNLMNEAIDLKTKNPKNEQDILDYQTTLLESYGWYKVNM